MQRMWTLAFVLAAVCIGCGREQWPSPPPVDPTTYQKEHEAWLAGERAYLSEVLPITGIWPLGSGATSFGADPALPIALPAAHIPSLAGAFRRVGDTVTVTPVGDFALRLEDGSRLDGSASALSRASRIATASAILFKDELVDASKTASGGCRAVFTCYLWTSPFQFRS
jgi:hypothetical protein